ncbi:uncharacterized protein [Triticum aestivum]|uniref:uncharacterized protein isoform X1 n=1 Tax=Triticum aestivum TaxID=4565 RepID=UPI001D033DDF|nr:uncharacterized protein LOC123147827 isoform X1 [Triticum aestivum]
MWRRVLPMAPEAARQEPPSRGGKSPSTRPLRLRRQGPTAPDPGASSRRRSRRLLMHLVMGGWTSATSRQFLKFFLQPVESYMMCNMEVLLKGRRKVMVDSHKEERQIMFVVNSFTYPAYGKFCNDVQRHTTLKSEMNSFTRGSFVSYVSAQKAYIEALDGWLSKFILTDTICYSRGISLIVPDRAGTPPLVVITSGTPCCRRLDRSSSLVTPA